MSESDEGSAAGVAPLGQTVVKNLFSAYENPIGATIFIKGGPLGGDQLCDRDGQDQDDTVLIPFSTAERKVLGSSTPTENQAAPKTRHHPIPSESSPC